MSWRECSYSYLITSLSSLPPPPPSLSPLSPPNLSPSLTCLGQKDLELVSHRAMDNHQLLSFADDEEEEEEVEELTAYHGSLKESKKSEASNTSQPEQQRRPSKDTFLRWSSLVIYLVISLPLTVAMAALVALQY